MFQIGDIVQSKMEYGPVSDGDIGRVCKEGIHSVGVSFFNVKSGHDCDGCCMSGSGWYMPTARLQIVQPCDIDEEVASKLIGDIGFDLI